MWASYSFFFKQIGAFSPGYDNIFSYLTQIPMKCESNTVCFVASVYVEHRGMTSPFNHSKQPEHSRFWHQSADASASGWVFPLRRFSDGTALLSKCAVDGVQESCHHLSGSGDLFSLLYKAAVNSENFNLTFLCLSHGCSTTPWRQPSSPPRQTKPSPCRSLTTSGSHSLLRTALSWVPSS